MVSSLSWSNSNDSWYSLMGTQTQASSNTTGGHSWGPIVTFLGFGMLIVPAIMVFSEMGMSWKHESGVLTVNLQQRTKDS